MQGAGMLLYFADEAAPALALARELGLPAHEVQRHLFPDGEARLKLPAACAARTVVFRSLNQPNHKLIDLLLCARTARTLGAQHLTLVAPYLAYMRQDIAFSPGEAISQRIVGGFLATLFDAVVTVDPHLHRVATLQEAVPVAQPVVLSATAALADHVARLRPGALLLGPDEESGQWVAQAAARHGNPYAVCTKVRSGDRHVQVALPEGEAWQGRAVVVLDDMVSTGHTVAQAAQQLRAAGVASVDVAVTHALFAEGALEVMRAAGVNEIWSTDCVAHATSVVPMAPWLAQGVQAVQAQLTG